MEGKLFDSELKVMEILWREGEASAKDIAVELAKTIGWSKTTTYTVLKKCVDKGAALRLEGDFRCRPAVSREEVQQSETEQLIDRLYDGSADHLVASLLGGRKLSAEKLAQLQEMVYELERGETQ